MLVFLTGTILCSVTVNLIQLIIFRAIQGLGAYSSILLTINTDSFEDKARSKAISYYSASLSGGYLIGTMLGGILSEFIGIRGVFYVCARLITMALAAIIFLVPETAPMRAFPSSKLDELNEPKKRDSDLDLGELKGRWKFVIKRRFLFGVP